MLLDPPRNLRIQQFDLHIQRVETAQLRAQHEALVRPDHTLKRFPQLLKFLPKPTLRHVGQHFGVFLTLSVGWSGDASGFALSMTGCLSSATPSQITQARSYRTASTSAKMATAISAGVREPISSPMGARIRARSSSLKPCCLSARFRPS